MNKSILALSFSAACAVGAASGAQASVVTFNNIPALGFTSPPQLPLMSGGLDFATSSLLSGIAISDYDPDKPGNGTNYLAFASFQPPGVQYLSITQQGGGDFNLYSIDMMQSAYTASDAAPDTVTIKYWMGGTQHTYSPSVSITNSFTTLNLELYDVTEVDIYTLHRLIPGSPASGFWALDNVYSSATGPVPEPATWAMILTGFGGIGALVRRRRQVASVAEG